MKAYMLDIGVNFRKIIFADGKETAMVRFKNMLDGWSEFYNNDTFISEHIEEFEILENTIIDFGGYM